MASIAVRLWCPEHIPTSEIIHIVNDSLQRINMVPPFTDTLQAIIDRSVSSSSRLHAYCFRLTFPRGPVISTEQLPLSRNPTLRLTNHLFSDRQTPRTMHTINLSDLPMFESSHTASSRSVPYSIQTRDTLIRDIQPGMISPIGSGFSRTYRVHRQRTAQRLRSITHRQVPSHACTVAITCAICLNDTEIGEVVSRLPCTHTFHKKCLVPWLSQANTCPTCRFELT